MLDKLIFALEKLTALLTSQRTVATIAGVAVLAVAMWGIIGPLLGVAVAAAPDDPAIEESVAQWLTVAVTAMTGLLSILALISKLVDGLVDYPPSLERTDYENLRQPQIEPTE